MSDLPLGLRSHLLVAPSSLVVHPAQNCLVLRTLDRDDFYMGNVLFLPAPPSPSSLKSLLERWSQAFADAPGVTKLVLQWETPVEQPVDTATLAEAGGAHGLELDRDLVLRLRQFVPAEARVPMRARPVVSEEDWAAVLAVATPSDATPGRRAFTAWRQQEYRHMVELGRGLWWMGELDGQAVASAGIFWDEGGRLARFQRVDTREDARGQGCATGLLSAMLADLLARQPQLETCVIVAALGGQAERIYRRLGFEPVNHLDALWGDRPLP